MKAIAITFSALGTQVWTPGEELILRALLAIGSRVLLSFDPAHTVASFQTPGANGQDRNFIALANTNTNATEFALPVSAGEGIFVSCGGVGTAAIFYDTLS